MAQVWVGTSGWVYRHWRDLFYPEDLPQKRWLEHYASVFSTVELNSTFYHTPTEAAVRGWYERTPSGFLFVVKGSRYISHTLRLRGASVPLALQRQRLAALGEKHGPVLWQTPPSLQADPQLLRDFLALRPPAQHWAFEFRHASWFCEEVYAVLRERNCCLVWADSPRYPLAKAVTADFLYARFHGHERLYASDYRQKDLAPWRDDLLAASEGQRDIFAYFNNDYHAYAVKNALCLQEMLAG